LCRSLCSGPSQLPSKILVRCLCPHFSIASRTSFRVLLYSVSSYCTVTGLVSQTFRRTNPLISSSCSSLDRILGEIPTSRESSLNPLLPLRNTDKRTNFHFPPTISRVSRIAIFALAQRSAVYSITILYVSTILFVTDNKGIVSILKFATTPNIN